MIDVRTNAPALKALTSLNSINKLVLKGIEQLSTGYRINSAGDDAAGLTLSEKLRTQIRGYEVASRNVQAGSTVLNIADGALQQVYDRLQRVRELAVEASNSTTTDYTNYQNEINAIRTEIDTVVGAAKYNNSSLLTSAAASSFSIMAGPNASDAIDIGSAFVDARATSATGLGLTTALSGANFANTTQASAYIATVDTALSTLNSRIATVGRFQNTMSTMQNYIDVAYENYQAADASIRNTDLAKTTSELARNQILQSISNAMLSQANNLPTLVLGLLQ
jgi:flagellin